MPHDRIEQWKRDLTAAQLLALLRQQTERALDDYETGRDFDDAWFAASEVCGRVAALAAVEDVMRQRRRGEG